MDEGDYDVVPISALREFPEHLKDLKTLPKQVSIFLVNIPVKLVPTLSISRSQLLRAGLFAS